MIEYVYVAGPIKIGGEFQNVRRAIIEGDILLTSGYTPFVPHVTCLWDIIQPNDYETWLAYDFKWIKRCDALLRIPGESFGADREVELAESLDLVIVYGSAYDFISRLGKGPNASPTD